jgi:hypothetical protein
MYSKSLTTVCMSGLRFPVGTEMFPPHVLEDPSAHTNPNNRYQVPVVPSEGGRASERASNHLQVSSVWRFTSMAPDAFNTSTLGKDTTSPILFQINMLKVANSTNSRKGCQRETRFLAYTIVHSGWRDNNFTYIRDTPTILDTKCLFLITRLSLA